jgi:hypothetical protein
MLVLLDDRDAGFRVARVGARDRLVARLRAPSLDGALAGGASPDSTAALALRARHLVRPSVRGYLARSLRRVAREDQRHRARRVTGPSLGHSVEECSDEIDALAERLVTPGPVSVRGVAQVRVLLSDGAGPLYRRSSREEVADKVRDARDSLEPRVAM